MRRFAIVVLFSAYSATALACMSWSWRRIAFPTIRATLRYQQSHFRGRGFGSFLGRIGSMAALIYFGSAFVALILGLAGYVAMMPFLPFVFLLRWI